MSVLPIKPRSWRSGGWVRGALTLYGTMIDTVAMLDLVIPSLAV